MTKVTFVAEVRPSEDEDKVKVAIMNFFDFESIRVEEKPLGKVIFAEANSLSSLKKMHRVLREERILDAARKYLRRGIQGKKITFMIHKQAASVGVLSFVDDERESPLGPIEVTIEYENPEEVVDWLAPKTARGRPLWENPIPDEVRNRRGP